MGDSLSKVEKNLKALAKRYESVRYSKGLAILFLMLGVNAFSEENVEDHNQNQNQNTTDTDGNKNENSSESISKIQIKSTAVKLKERLEQLKKENEKNLSSEKLELIKLMEQGDQVVKSPWSSWQFGANTFQDFSVGKYKGTGDKAEKYPYEGIFTRSSNIYHRHISPESKKYEDVVSEMSKETKVLSGLKYGLNTTKKVKEPIVELEFPATIRPKGGEEINLTKPSKENKVVIAKVELPHFEIPDDKTKPAPPTSARATNSSGKSLKTVISKADYANIKKGNGESGTLVGQMESDVAGPISQTNINGKNGKGKIEIIHNNTDEFTIKSENTIFTGIEGTDHHQVFTYDTNLNNKYKYEAETGPMIIRAGGGHNFEISNMNITSKGEIEEVITNIFELNAGDNQKTKLTLKENTDVVVDSNLTTVVKLTNHTSKSSLDFINEGKITVNNNNNYVSMIANMNSEKNMSYFENKGDIIINGKSNRGIIELKNSSYFFKNEGNLILDGEINYFLPSRAEAESIIQLNKPLKIIGKLNRGVILTPNIRKFDREYNGKLEKSYFNMELSGERNTGIYIFDPSSSIGNTVNIENFNLKSRNGKQNNLVVVNGLKNKIATLSKNGEHSNFEIIGGEGNTAIQVAASQNVKNEGSIKLTDATSSTAIASRGLVDAKGEVTPASMTNEGKIEVSGNSTKALHSYDDGKIINVGEITFNGSSSNDGLGALAIYSNSSGEIESTANANITVDGSKSAGLFARNKSTNPNLQKISTIKISNANITAKNGAFNVFADKGGEITLNENNVLNTENSSLTFFTNYNSAAPGGKIIFNNDVTANIKKGGTVFYYDLENATIGNFNFTNWYNLNFVHNNSSKLKLNMEDKSRLMLLANANLNFSEIPDNIQNSNLEINGNNYIPISIIDSKLNINSDINLDDASNKYNKIEIIRSSITNQNTISGTLNNQVAIAQENNNTNPSSKIVLENEGTINLNGDNSTAIYSKRGKINNKSEISIKNNSVGLHLEENNSLAIADGEIQNNGNISIGENSTAILYKGEKTGTFGETSGIYNNGHIISNSLNSIGMYFDSQFSTKEIVNNNNGNIELNGADSIGMYGLGNGSYNLKNLGTIKLGSSKNKDTFSLGIYTKNSNATIYNNGNITMGDYGIGIYGSKITADTASNVKVKNNSVAFYSTGNDLNLQGKVDVEGENSTGVLLSGSNQNLTANFGEMKIGNNSLGIADVGVSNKITSNTSHVNLNNDSIYIYSKDSNGHIENNTEIKTLGDRNYSIYSSGKVINNADMDLRDGFGNIGIYSSGLAGAENYRTIKVGASQRNDSLYSMGMATGFYSSDDNSVTNIGKIVNKNTGKIVVEGDYGIGMYAVGQGSEAINDGEIILNGKNSIGMFLDQNAVGINNGKISATANAMKAIGAVVANGAVLKNYGTIDILPSDGVGVWLLKKGKLEEYASSTSSELANSSTINAHKRVKTSEPVDSDKKLSDGSVKISVFKRDETNKITINGKNVVYESIDKGSNNENIIEKYKAGKLIDKIDVSEENSKKTKAEISKIGMYIDTSGIKHTNPIQGLNNLDGEVEVDLIIGTEATKYSNSKGLEIGKNIVKPYSDVIEKNPQIEKWGIYSGSLTWIGTAQYNFDYTNIEKIYLAKIPYTKFYTDTDNYNFLDGLEQRYGVEALGSRENKVFQKLNDIGKNEQILFTQAVDEMMGHQYANTQQRVKETSNILDKEFNYLRKDWQNFSKDSNKIKTFATHGKYETNTAGVIDYTNNAYGVAYVHEDETVRLGKTTGWYAGIVDNKFNFKDIGNSKEEQLQGKIGVFKSIPFDYDNSLNLTISGDLSVGYNRMNRRFLVVDEIFGAKAKYYTYAAGLKNELSKEIRLSEDFSFKPYAQARVEYGKISKIKEKSGEMKLEVKANDYYSIKPEAGAELIFKYSFGSYKTVKAVLSAAYEKELGKIADGRNQAKVADTSADYFNIRGEKENREGNIKTDLKVGVDNSRVGLTANVGYDTKSQNIRGGVGVRFIF